MSLALLFPGQGTQHAQMLPWLEDEPAARPLLHRIAAALGSDWRDRLADPAWATENAVAQPLLVGIESAAWACLAGRLPAPAVIAGYSVGEVAAFGAAGVFDAGTALDLARVRAEVMARSAGQPTGLMATRDVPLSVIEAWCRRYGLSVAIRLGPDRAIVGGSAEAMRAAAADPAMAGARISDIGVRIASHTPWMRAAAEAFASHLAAIPVQAPAAALVCNLTGTATRDSASLARCLSAQIASPVLWDACMETIAERQVGCVLEIGPGTTLASLWRASYPNVPARSIDEFRSAAAVAGWVAKVLGGGR
ncbi:MAG: acyltransferase domain-containing protein [Caldimonas sp.]